MTEEKREESVSQDGREGGEFPPTFENGQIESVLRGNPTSIEASAAIRAALSDVTERSETTFTSSSVEAAEAAGRRPPLAPPPPPPAPAPIIQPRPPTRANHHSRLQSTSEFSFMSALTEGSDDGEQQQRPPRSSKNRAVSFDQNLFDSAGIEPNILQPVLQDELPTNGSRSPHTRSDQTRKRTRTLDLADLIADNPLETEAETAIIAAIEAESRMEENRRRADSASVVMPHVPDEGLDMFETESTESKKQTITSPLRSSTHSRETRDAPLSPSPKSRHRRTKSRMPPEGIDFEQSETLENHLSGLASAMRKIHVETTGQVDESEIKRNHRRLPSHDIGHLAAKMEDIPVNNADVLVHNANLLLRRNVLKDHSRVEHGNAAEQPEQEMGAVQEPKTKPIWNIFESKRDLKKTDGDHLDNVDEVSGESSGGASSSPLEISGDESSQTTTDEVEVAGWDIEEGIEEDINDIPPRLQPGKNKFSKTRNTLKMAKRGLKQDIEMFSEFLRPKRGTIGLFCKIAFFYLLVPLVGVAAILFYLAGNPLVTKSGASISWILLFVSRQIVTFSMAQGTQLLTMFVSLKTPYVVRIFGPTISLYIVQSKGVPFILTCWSIYDFMLMSGAHPLADHWLFWQSLIALCNSSNPSGDIPSTSTNYRILGSVLGAGIAISAKRFWVGLYLGRRTYANYGDQLAKVIENMLLISEVASEGRDFERRVHLQKSPKLRTIEQSLSGWNFEDMQSVEENSGAGQRPALERPTAVGMLDRKTSVSNANKVIEEGHRNPFTGTLSPSQRIKVAQLLDHWEEPETVQKRQTGASINAILQFRQALTFMDNDFPFSLAYGPAEDREACIESAQKVFERLLLGSPGCDRLPFDTIAMLAVNKDGTVDHKLMKTLIRIFRPDREGNLTMLDFVRSCDTVYKSLRLLRASIANAGQIDHAFEVLINYAFFVILICVILAANGFNPLALFLSFSSIILAFAFMIGSASSKYFEGILFILVRRPYDIGDRIAVADVNSGTNIDGTLSWFVQNVSLFTTTVRFSATNEVATIANGSLASSRIINCARSPKAVVHVFLKFGVDIPYARIQCFKKAVENFVKARPREWVALARFRATRIEADLGFIEYALDLQHRDSWQHHANILMSKADLASFCLEVSKQLDMRYSAPSLPVDLNLKGKRKLLQLNEATSQQEDQSNLESSAKGSPLHSPASSDVRAISALFEGGHE